MIAPADLERAAAHSTTALEGLAERDWGSTVPGMGWTVRDTVEHLVDALGFYTLHLTAESADRLRVDIRCHDGISNSAVVEILTAQAHGLARVAELLPPSARAWHFQGPSDVSGFVAMACAELLLHTDDARRGLGTALQPAARLAGQVVRRLFPSAPEDADPWQTLLWATGRGSLEGYADVGGDWAYDPAPR